MKAKAKDRQRKQLKGGHPARAVRKLGILRTDAHTRDEDGGGHDDPGTTTQTSLGPFRAFSSFRGAVAGVSWVAGLGLNKTKRERAGDNSNKGLLEGLQHSKYGVDGSCAPMQTYSDMQADDYR